MSYTNRVLLHQQTFYEFTSTQSSPLKIRSVWRCLRRLHLTSSWLSLRLHQNSFPFLCHYFLQFRSFHCHNGRYRLLTILPPITFKKWHFRSLRLHDPRQLQFPLFVSYADTTVILRTAFDGLALSIISMAWFFGSRPNIIDPTVSTPSPIHLQFEFHLLLYIIPTALMKNSRVYFTVFHNCSCHH